MDDGNMNQVAADVLPAAIEENLRAFYAFLAQHTTCSQHAMYGIRWMCPENSTWPNLIYSTEMNSGSLESDIASIITDIKKAIIPPVWLVGPLARPLNLPEVLEAHGLLPVMQWSGMALALEELQQEVDVPELTIEAVDNAMALSEWLEVVQAGLLRNSRIAVEYFATLLGQEEVKLYLARVAGKPVGTALLFLQQVEGQKIAGLYLISVLPEYRGRGIGRHLTLQPLYAARQQGSKLAVLQATQLGEGVYRRVGFREYCRFRIYKYQS